MSPAPNRGADRLDVRRHNLSLILRMLEDQGPRSRAGLAAVSGLTKATVSSLVAELTSRRLVREVGPESDQRMGRPATLVALDEGHLVTLGVEVNVGQLTLVAADLHGRPVHEERSALRVDVADADAAVPLIARRINDEIARLRAEQRIPVGVTVAVPGIVDVERGVVTFAPNLGWRGVALRRSLLALLAPEVSLAVMNEANLGALAEHRLGGHGSCRDLVYVLATDGVGAGVIVDGVLLHGAGGAAGELGHTTIQARGQLCNCGSRGCWETLIGLRGLLGATVPADADELYADRTIDAEAKVAVVTARARAHDRAVIDGLRAYGRWLGLGLANAIDTFNPSVIVLGGILPDLAPWALPEAIDTVTKHSLTDSARACRIELTRLGFAPSARGAAVHAAERVFADPTVVPPTGTGA